MSTTPQPTAPVSRSRPQARRKPNDDASYFGPATAATNLAGVKRQAADKVEGEPRKRKRVEPITTILTTKRDGTDGEQRTSLVEFVKMPTLVLYKYLTVYDIIPPVYPSPMSAEDPAPPSSLIDPIRQSPREPSPPILTPANRPRRDPKESRRRSSRLLEEARSRTPILSDLEELHVTLAALVDRHFRDTPSISGREEVDTLASFMCAVEKAKGSRVKS